MNRYLEQAAKLFSPEVKSFIQNNPSVYEIRVRPEKKVFVVTEKGNFPCGPILSPDEFNHIFSVLNGGSLYKHEDTLPYGFFTDSFGGRCGVVCDIAGLSGEGRAVIKVNGLNLRVPRFIRGVSEPLCQDLSADKAVQGTLIYAAPCTGKTTVIRDIARYFSEFPYRMRVCVIDERREFDSRDYRADANIDILSGYSKKMGIEVAIRTLSAQLIICDEIGDFDDANGICQLANSGVPLIATAHAQTSEELFHKDAIRLMREKKIFTWYAHLAPHCQQGLCFDQMERL
ncbi:MAG: hypothetical protein HFE78_03870 [Clostridiales bacterium]|nr:hypothetical protein [Clostridiales bacterium]